MKQSIALLNQYEAVFEEIQSVNKIQEILTGIKK